MKKRFAVAGLVFLGGLSLILVRNDPPTNNSPDVQDDIEVSATDSAERLPSSTKRNSNSGEESPAPAARTELPKMIATHLPKRAPAGTESRWSHRIVFEDDRYIGTQLTFDNKPLENYNYRWLKGSDGEPAELVGGTLPQVAAINGAFMGPEQSQQVADSAVGDDGEILSVKEIWTLNSNRVLTPQVKVEVNAKSRSERSAGHEYWFIGVNSGRIVKRVEADRY